MGAAEVIRVENLTKIFRTRDSEIVALENVNLSVKEGEFLCIVGPSGCGKTTLLRIFAGLERQTHGKVYLRVKNTDNPLTAMVFQGDSIFPWMKVTENVEYGLRMRGIPARERKEIALKYLKLMGLEKFADYYPHQLSGGMKQRINVARAFASDPEILLMDEPFGALDEQNRLILQQELLRIWEGSGKTTVFITHSIDEALLLGDRIIVMTALPGKIKAILEVGLARPRDMLSIKSSPQFVELYKEIWGLLREEVLKARDIKC
ncbi:ABC transporter ATP-binding protein [Thermosediminibacter oceani]|uniref:ABC transporter related protein n=1 Tax=Thermosediminibacter oceani (strain ATCC BAA-1034 / DSM 16646 / JW/IW-1228P) TaxID=555079 RepID=D9RYC7_THEOJ|nr:ABC transporter ATP-binding protein [Thermosediminibacter oceani]ADL08351.1 ABC transporter related protein [Thermosediminibacter oceani DSM 16646]